MVIRNVIMLGPRNVYYRTTCLDGPYKVPSDADTVHFHYKSSILPLHFTAFIVLCSDSGCVCP